MRSISTDDIESVEVVRGIPSAEYGNLTSGMVKINKIRRETPFTARFKADGYSKLVSVGKGLKLGRNGSILNIDGGILDAKPDPTDNLENYRRANASLRLTHTVRKEKAEIRITSSADYTGSFDNSKQDPNLNYGRIDEYKSTYNRISLTNNFTVRPHREYFLRNSRSIRPFRSKSTGWNSAGWLPHNATALCRPPRKKAYTMHISFSPNT